MRGLFILSVDHTGKPAPKERDLGAVADLDGDGEIEVAEGEHEVHVIREYVAAAAEVAPDFGLEVFVIDPAMTGEQLWYWERHKRAIDEAWKWNGPVAYIACHANAGGGRRGESWHHPSSAMGKRLAECIAGGQEEALGRHITHHAVKAASGRRLTPIRGTYQDTRHGIDRTPGNLCGVTFEPIFMDYRPHQEFIRDGGLVIVGEALAGSVAAWAEEWIRDRRR